MVYNTLVSVKVLRSLCVACCRYTVMLFVNLGRVCVCVPPSSLSVYIGSCKCTLLPVINCERVTPLLQSQWLCLEFFACALVTESGSRLSRECIPWSLCMFRALKKFILLRVITNAYSRTYLGHEEPCILGIVFRGTVLSHHVHKLLLVQHAVACTRGTCGKRYVVCVWLGKWGGLGGRNTKWTGGYVKHERAVDKVKVVRMIHWSAQCRSVEWLETSLGQD